MFIRRKPNKSGTFSVQVLDKRDGRNVLLRSFGSSMDESELIYMEREASDFISRFGGQGVLDFDEDGVNGFVATIGDDVHARHLSPAHWPKKSVRLSTVRPTVGA